VANKFEVQIVALDRFTKTFRDLNNRASKTARPLVNVQRQIGALAREAHLDKVAKGLGRVSDAAVTVGRTLGVSLGPLESILGMGAAGGIIGAVGAAGIAAMSLGARFAAAGFEVSRTSQLIGVSERDLQRYRGAARLAKVDEDAMTQSMANLGTTLQDARFGRNVTALQMLGKFGLGIHTDSQGVIDTVKTWRELSDVLHNVADPHVRQVIADAFGIRESLPLLTQGAKAMEDLGDQAEKSGTVKGKQALQWSNDFTESLNRMQEAIRGVSDSLGARMVPSLTRAMDVVTNRLTESHTNPVKAWWGFNEDAIRGGMKVTGVGALIDKVQGLFRGPALTTPAQRTVRGTIGGPAWPTHPGKGANDLSASENAALDDFTPAERARQQANEDSAENRRQLVAELARTRDPGNRAILQGELNKLDSRVQVEVAFKNAPPGTTATARSSSANAYVPTRISYSMPTGDMP
jgi:hypothetical protein